MRSDALAHAHTRDRLPNWNHTNCCDDLSFISSDMRCSRFQFRGLRLQVQGRACQLQRKDAGRHRDKYEVQELLPPEDEHPKKDNVRRRDVGLQPARL